MSPGGTTESSPGSAEQSWDAKMKGFLHRVHEGRLNRFSATLNIPSDRARTRYLLVRTPANRNQPAIHRTPSTPMPSQQQIVKSIAAMAKRLGRAPSLLEFVTGARIPKNSVFRLFPRWNDAVRAAGLQPYTLYLPPEHHQLLTAWAETLRKLGVVPSRRAYDLNGKHYPITLEKRFGGWPALS